MVAFIAMVRLLTFGLGLVFSSCAVPSSLHAGSGDGRVLLRYAPTAGELRYHHTMDTATITTVRSTSKRTTSSTIMKLGITMTKSSNSRLQCALVPRNVICLLSTEHEPKRLPFSDRSISWEMLPNGEVTWVGARFGFDVEALVHRLRDSPVSQGETWTGSLAAKDKKSPPAVVQYVLLGFVDIDRVRCANIMWTVGAEWSDKSPSMCYRVQSKGQLLFDCNLGRIRTIISQMDLTGTSPSGDGVQQHAEQTMQLVGED